jgi:hypothetical protein
MLVKARDKLLTRARVKQHRLVKNDGDISQFSEPADVTKPTHKQSMADLFKNKNASSASPAAASPTSVESKTFMVVQKEKPVKNTLGAHWDFQTRKAFIKHDGAPIFAQGDLIQMQPLKQGTSAVGAEFVIEGTTTILTVGGIWWSLVQASSSLSSSPSVAPMVRPWGDKKKEQDQPNQIHQPTTKMGGMECRSSRAVGCSTLERRGECSAAECNGWSTVHPPCTRPHCTPPNHPHAIHPTQFHSTPLRPSTPSTPLHSIPSHSTRPHLAPPQSTPLHSISQHYTALPPLHSTPLHFPSS